MYIAKSPTGRVGTRNTHATRTPMARATMRRPTEGPYYAPPAISFQMRGRGGRPSTTTGSGQRAARDRAAIDRVAAVVRVVAPEEAAEARGVAFALGRDRDPFVVRIGE